MNGKKLLALSASALLISACGGGGSDGADPGTAPKASIGIFEDSPVAGLFYETATRSGFTNSSGEYEYLPTETITFSIGGIVLGSATGSEVITPLTLVAGATDATHPEVTNIVRLLMTLDNDGNPDNGISISTETAAAAVNQSVDFTALDLATDPGMIALLPLLPNAPSLVDALTAQTHFSATLAAQTKWGSMAWGNGTWQSKAP